MRILARTQTLNPLASVFCVLAVGSTEQEIMLAKSPPKAQLGSACYLPARFRAPCNAKPLRCRDTSAVLRVGAHFCWQGTVGRAVPVSPRVCWGFATQEQGPVLRLACSALEITVDLSSVGLSGGEAVSGCDFLFLKHPAWGK